MSRIILAILDGFWINTTNPSENAITQADAPTFNMLFGKPFTKLDASWLAVGIPEGQMWNSEVGHMTIGAGRTILQWTMKIDACLTDGSFTKLPEYEKSFSHIKETNGSLHIFTLFGNGGVHASQIHLEKALNIIPSNIQVYLHIFTDGRDLSPTSALWILKEFRKDILSKHQNIHISTISGRYYAMDRDNNYNRIESAYNAITGNIQETPASPEDVIQWSYNEGKTDEFINPTLIDSDGIVKNGDSIWFLNFRSDRARMLTEAFCENEFPHFIRKQLKNIYFVSMVPYYQSYTGNSFFHDENLTDTLWEILSRLGINQLRIAETEKFAHVTKFFNGGRFDAFDGEKRILIPSHKVNTYDLDPAMSANEITDTIIRDGKEYSVIIVNYANGDMVGHTGFIDAAKKAVESLDTNIKQLISFAKENNYEILLTADHGNCEEMWSPEEPKTSHTTNFVPCWHIVDGEVRAMQKNIWTLANIAPTMLQILRIQKPEIMTDSLGI